MTVLLPAGTVVRGPSQRAISPGTMLIEGEVVADVGPPDELAARHPDATRLDHPRGVVVPGLVDAHVHLAFDQSGNTAAVADQPDDDRLLLDMADCARELLSFGVTTARDVGDRHGLAVALRDGGTVGLRLLSATAPLTVHRGHCWFLGGEVDPTDHGALREAVDAPWSRAPTSSR